MARLYSVSMLTQPFIGTKPVAVDNKLSTLGDWIRFSPLQWYVWTDRSKAQLAAEIQSILVLGDQFIVVVVEPEFAQGNTPEWIWNWLNDKMVKQVTRS